MRENPVTENEEEKKDEKKEEKPKSKEKHALCGHAFSLWRGGRDSNPRPSYPRQSLSRRAHSAALAPPRREMNCSKLLAEEVGFEPTLV